MTPTRFSQNGFVAMYEMLWACNQSLLIVGISIIQGNGGLLRAGLIIASTDQILWYLDLTGYMFLRKFPIGVAKYIVWPETTKMRLLTTFHHIWFLPLGLYLSSPSAPGFTFRVFAVSMIMATLLVYIGLVSCPKEIVVNHKKDKPAQVIYMNLNISR